MVRLLKVKALEDRKEDIIAKSEMYRQTLKLEAANIKYSAALYKRKLKSPKTILTLLGLGALPAAGFFYGRKLRKEKHPEHRAERAGLFTALMTGVSMFRKVAPLIQHWQQRRRMQKRAATHRRHSILHHS